MKHLLEQFSAVLDPDQLKIPKTSPTDRLATILQIVFAFAGAAALIIIIIAAIRMVLSMGNPEGFSRARNTIIYAVIGLVICISAYSLVTFVVNRVTG